MRFTDFSELQNAIRLIGIDKFEAKLLEKLKLGELEGDTQNLENIILGEYGIYYLKQGKLGKVILHITDIDKMWIEKKDMTALNALNNKKYDALEFIKALHKYHFTKCKTLEKMFNKGRKNRYYLAQRTDGTFSYNVIEDNEVIYDSKRQKLNVCKNCLSVLMELTKKQYDVQNFKPTDVFNTNMVKLSETGIDLECNAVPNIYSNDWNKIAKKAKQQVNWKCEQCDINFTQDKGYLHCHHIDANRANNLLTNLKVLCIKCHAEQPNHEHLKKLPKYGDFLTKYAS